MKIIEVVCPMCDDTIQVHETALHIGEPVRCGSCYEVSSLVARKDPETGERNWILDYLKDADD